MTEDFTATTQIEKSSIMPMRNPVHCNHNLTQPLSRQAENNRLNLYVCFNNIQSYLHLNWFTPVYYILLGITCRQFFSTICYLRYLKQKWMVRVYYILDVDPQRDDDASPMSSYRCMSSPQVKILISNFLGKFFKFFGFHAVVLVKTFPLMYQLLM